MFTRNGISDSLLNAVKDVTKEDKEVSQYQAFGLTTEKKNMDPVGKGDADIDNDGDEDESDEYLHKRRKAIKKSMGKEKVVINPNMKESENAPSKENGGIAHNCATHVYSESWGDGRTVTTMHAEPDAAGNIAWYDVMFEHGIEKGVPIEEMKVVKSESHMHSKKKG